MSRVRSLNHDSANITLVSVSFSWRLAGLQPDNTHWLKIGQANIHVIISCCATADCFLFALIYSLRQIQTFHAVCKEHHYSRGLFLKTWRCAVWLLQISVSRCGPQLFHSEIWLPPWAYYCVWYWIQRLKVKMAGCSHLLQDFINCGSFEEPLKLAFF